MFDLFYKYFKMSCFLNLVDTVIKEYQNIHFFSSHQCFAKFKIFYNE